MILKNLLLTLALAGAANSLYAQKVIEGDLSALKGATEFNIQYDYSNMTVTTKNKPEDEFIADKREDLNKKDAGKGDQWAASWVADRDKRFAVQFKEEFEKQSDMKLVNSGAKYTLIFHTTHTETGFNVGVMRRNAYIDGVATIVDASNPGKVIARIKIDDCAGRTFGGYDFDTGTRLQESYAVAGKKLGKYIKKKS